MDRLPNYQSQRENTEEMINITVVCVLATGELEFTQPCSPQIEFNALVLFLQQTVFAQQLQSNYSRNIDYYIGRQWIPASDTRTLEQLGVKHGDTIKMRLHLLSYGG